MFFVLLIDKTVHPKPFFDDAKSHMNSAEFRPEEQNQDLATRPVLYMSIENGTIPYFGLEPDGDEKEFTKMFDKDHSTINVFTTMPAEQLKLYFGRYFRIDNSATVYFVQKKPIDDDLIMYDNRFFTITSQKNYQVNAYEKRIEKKEDFSYKTSYKGFLKPVLASFSDIEGVKKLFFNKQQLPFVLPAKGISVENNKSYFSKGISDIRQSFRDAMTSTETTDKYNLAPLSVIFKLMTLTEKGIYRDYLNEGGYWSVEAYKDTPSVIEGFTKLVFYYYPTTEIGIAELRNELLNNNNSDGEDIIAIKNALKGDMEVSEIREANVTREAACRVYSLMRIFEKEKFANTREGTISWIEAFIENCNEKNKAYILDKILAPYKEDSNDRGNDDINAVKNFNEHFFKCPLTEQAEIDWNEVVLKFFIQKKGFYSIQDVLREYKLTDYNVGLEAVTNNISVKCDTEDKILKLRLLLPLGTNIELINSNVLDSDNCILDNLVLE